MSGWGGRACRRVVFFKIRPDGNGRRSSACCVAAPQHLPEPHRQLPSAAAPQLVRRRRQVVVTKHRRHRPQPAPPPAFTPRPAGRTPAPRSVIRIS